MLGIINSSNVELRTPTEDLTCPEIFTFPRLKTYADTESTAKNICAENTEANYSSIGWRDIITVKCCFDVTTGMSQFPQPERCILPLWPVNKMKWRSTVLLRIDNILLRNGKWMLLCAGYQWIGFVLSRLILLPPWRRSTVCAFVHVCPKQPCHIKKENKLLSQTALLILFLSLTHSC